MTNLLAMDTTTDVCSVALVAGQRWFEQSRLAPRRHNACLLAMIDRLLAATGVARKALDVVAFGAGPGSFTGVRIGAAVAQGMAFGVGAQVVAVSSSAAAAEAARRTGDLRGAVAVWRQSRPGWHYLAEYELEDDDLRCLADDRLVASSDRPIAGVVVDARTAVGARWVAELALRNIDQAVPPALALPRYVAGDHPWRPPAPPH